MRLRIKNWQFRRKLFPQQSDEIKKYLKRMYFDCYDNCTINASCFVTQKVRPGHIARTGHRINYHELPLQGQGYHFISVEWVLINGKAATCNTCSLATPWIQLRLLQTNWLSSLLTVLLDTSWVWKNRLSYLEVSAQYMIKLHIALIVLHDPVIPLFSKTFTICNNEK